MSVTKRHELKEKTRSLFYHGFDSYMTHAFPEDELQPLTCTGRGSDRTNGDNFGINDICGDFSLTLIDTLDMLPILGDQARFERGVRDVIDTVSFDADSKVQIFEVTIRVLGGLLSAHQYATLPFLNSTISWYNDELLHLAVDLGNRLLPAFDTLTGIPHPRINLRHGLKGLSSSDPTETCAAGASSLTLEFITLSRLTGIDSFEHAARRAYSAIWDRRMNLGLVGNTLDIHTGLWTSVHTGIGAGIDSFYEYAFKSWVLFGDDYFYDVWHESQRAISNHVADAHGMLYRNVHVTTGYVISNFIDSLSAYYAGLLVQAGRIEEATKSYLVYHSLWIRFGAIPERFNYMSRQVEIPWYPLRPEFIESTYFLYRATKDPFYLAVGQQILDDLERLKQQCGFAGYNDVVKKTLDDRMESFLLSESFKYLYLLFDEDHLLNTLPTNWVFTTEGHPLFPLPQLHTHKSTNVTQIDSCQPQSLNSPFSKVMYRPDFYHSQAITNPDSIAISLPLHYPINPSSLHSAALPISNEFEVLFGVAASLVNTSANIVQLGKNIIISSLQGFGLHIQKKY